MRVHAQQPAEQGDNQSFRFKTGVELINVTATVTDQNGRFVSGLQQDDFRVYQDDELQPITHFNAERVPVSLGIVLDTSGSMEGEKIAAAREALDRFLSQLLDPDDEVFLYRFDNDPTLIQGWTTDKRRISDALARMQPRGGTAMYDAVAEAMPLAQSGRNRKKALVIISDGNDTSSRIDVQSVKQLIRETEVLVYAIGIDSQRATASCGRSARASGRPAAAMPTPFPFPMPGGAPAAAAAAAGPSIRRRHPRGSDRRHGRSRQRRRAARHHRRQRRTHRDHPLARATSIRRPRASPTS